MRNMQSNYTISIIAFISLGYILIQQFMGEKEALIFLSINQFFLVYDMWWQPISSIIMHGSYMHLAMNMVTLFQIGSLIESARGGKFLTVLFVLGGVATSLISFLFIYIMGFNHFLVGASGAISVLIGWVACKSPYHAKGLFISLLVISFVPLFLGINIAWYAHLIGFGIGYFYAKVGR